MFSQTGFLHLLVLKSIFNEERVSGRESDLRVPECVPPLAAGPLRPPGHGNSPRPNQSAHLSREPVFGFRAGNESPEWSRCTHETLQQSGTCLPLTNRKGLIPHPQRRVTFDRKSENKDARLRTSHVLQRFNFNEALTQLV